MEYRTRHHFHHHRENHKSHPVPQPIFNPQTRILKSNTLKEHKKQHKHKYISRIDAQMQRPVLVERNGSHGSLKMQNMLRLYRPAGSVLRY